MIAPYHVVSPIGRLVPEIVWPGQSTTAVGEKLAAFIADGHTRSGGIDAATTLWVYYRATDEQYQRMIGMPSSVTDSDEGSSQYTDAQIERIKVERDQYLAEFEELVEAVDLGDVFEVIQSLR